MDARPRLYFAFRSPYSWLAVERLRKAMPNMHDRIEFVPCWEPGPLLRKALDRRGAGVHYAPMSRAKHLYILSDVKRLAHRDGFQVSWPVDKDPWWDLPHLAWLAASDRGMGARLYEAIVSARWERGQNICDPDVLQAVGLDVGVEPDLLTTAVDDPTSQARGTKCLAAAWDDGVFGVPYFRAGRHRFWGVDRLEDFLDVLASSHAATDPLRGIPAAAQSALSGYGSEPAGGCG